MGRTHLALKTIAWANARRRALERDFYRCTACHKPGRLEVHHVEALTAGGDPYKVSNLRSLCTACHVDLHRPDVPEWAARWREELIRFLIDKPL